MTTPLSYMKDHIQVLQSELDKANKEVEHYLSAYEIAHKQAMDNGQARDKANARIAQLEDALSYARYFSLDDEATSALNAVRDNPLPSTWLSQHDKAIEVKVLEEAILRFENFGAGYEMFTGTIADELTCMIDSRK